MSTPETPWADCIVTAEALLCCCMRLLIPTCAPIRTRTCRGSAQNCARQLPKAYIADNGDVIGLGAANPKGMVTALTEASVVCDSPACRSGAS